MDDSGSWNLNNKPFQKEEILSKAKAGLLLAYDFQPENIDRVVRTVIESLAFKFPDGELQPLSSWRFFESVDIKHWVNVLLAITETEEKERVVTELALLSAVMNTDVGNQWFYLDAFSRRKVTGEQGIGLAVLTAYETGKFSLNEASPYRVDTLKLLSLSNHDLIQIFQCHDQQSVTDLKIWQQLLNTLAHNYIEKHSSSSSSNDSLNHSSRIGDWIDKFIIIGESHDLCSNDKKRIISLKSVYDDIIDWMEPVWMDGHSYSRYHKDAEPGTEKQWFYSWAQWLCYSLADAWQKCGIEVQDQDILNLVSVNKEFDIFLQTHVIVPKMPSKSVDPSAVESEYLQLTTALLEVVSEKVEDTIGQSIDGFMLRRILEKSTRGSASPNSELLRELDRSPGGRIEIRY